MSKLNKLIKSGRVSVIDLPAKRKELFKNQLRLFKDDLDNMKTLFEKDKYRGAFIHAFNAFERGIDMLLILKGIKVRDRYTREIAIEEKLGEEFLGDFEELYDRRKNGMYETGFITRNLVLAIVEEKIPLLVKKINEILSKEEKIKLDKLI